MICACSTCERVVFAIRAHGDHLTLTVTADELDELIDATAAEANHEGVQAVCAGVREGHQSADRLVEVRPADNETFRPRSQQDPCPAGIDRLPRGPHAVDGQPELVKRLRRIAGRVLDRQAGD